jgi:CheY-like chemotaxis protein
MTHAEEIAPLRVLVADDEPDHRALLVAALRECGYQLVLAHDGRELLDLLWGMPPQHFAAVVCDVFMPGLRGTEVLARGASRSRFILVTAFASETVEHTAAEFGAAAVVSKPYDPRALVELIASVIGHGDASA